MNFEDPDTFTGDWLDYNEKRRCNYIDYRRSKLAFILNLVYLDNSTSHFPLWPLLSSQITSFPPYTGTLDYMCPQRLRGEPYNFEVSEFIGYRVYYNTISYPLAMWPEGTSYSKSSLIWHEYFWNQLIFIFVSTYILFFLSSPCTSLFSLFFFVFCHFLASQLLMHFSPLSRFLNLIRVMFGAWAAVLSHSWPARDHALTVFNYTTYSKILCHERPIIFLPLRYNIF